MILSKRKYVPDLSEYMSQCEINYALMSRLLLCVEKAETEVDEGFDPEPFVEDSLETDVHLPIHLKLVEQARYTTTLELSMTLSESAWVSPLVLKVRMYHDAKMAEVLESGRNHAPKPKHDYPEQVRHYPDDKFQRNRLLNLCLTRCFDTSAKTVTLPKVTDLTQGS